MPYQICTEQTFTVFSIFLNHHRFKCILGQLWQPLSIDFSKPFKKREREGQGELGKRQKEAERDS